jgi:hypothetical protein
MKQYLTILFVALLINQTNAQLNTSHNEIEVGKPYQGGIIAYILQSGDLGFDNNIKHGIIVSKEDLSLGVRWYNGISTMNIVGARGTSIGYGKINTDLILNNHGEKRKNYAARIAADYRGGGFNDWFLPSIDELNKLFINRNELGISDGWYWSSTEGDNFNVWYIDFKFGFKDLTRHNSLRVRAVRKF